MNPEIVQTWLNKYHNGDRDWLATQCGVKRSTVNSWFSNRPIPRHAEAIIRRLMETDRAESVGAPQNLVIEVSSEQFDAYNRAAMKNGMLIREWLIHIVEEAANADGAVGNADRSDSQSKSSE